MAIKKQEFYEGAALHLAARTGRIRSLRYDAPFFFFNDRLAVLLKYSTRSRSPWGFTFTPDEQNLLQAQTREFRMVIGLICGADGIAAFGYEAYLHIAAPRPSAIHVSCRRLHGEHYEVAGPDGVFERKVAPSSWQKLFEGCEEQTS